MEHTQNGKAFYVKAEIRESQSGSIYVWTKSFDLANVVRELGTAIVTITMVKPRNAKTEAERLVIFKASDTKFTTRNNGVKRTEQSAENSTKQKDNLI